MADSDAHSRNIAPVHLKCYISRPKKTYTEMQRAYLVHYDDKNEEKEPQVQFPKQPFLDFFSLITVGILVADVPIPLGIHVCFDIAQQPVQ